MSRTHKAAAIVAMLVCVGLLTGGAHAGYEAPPFIDGGQSMDGRFVVTAEHVSGTRIHGPHQWRFVWRDTKLDQTIRFDAQEVQGGQIYAHLFVAPDGETFALWNHVTLYTKGPSNMHGAAKLPAREETDAWRTQEAFSHRLVIYRKDGSVAKQLSVGDFLQPDEWETVLPVFNRVHWISEYPGLKFKQTPRPGYAFYRISPDYTVLEFLVRAPRTKKGPDGRRAADRVVRVSLTDGRILGDDEPIADPNKLPVRPYLGPEHLPGPGKEWREAYVPSLDPVRVEGRYRIEPAPPAD